ncbi:type VI secretion system contractile sheath protein TssC [Segetibacter sp. 3557_3]|nr:type VI secretion system contractile sheath protein TssC [Segetibacter sp. 3557_3]
MAHELEYQDSPNTWVKEAQSIAAVEAWEKLGGFEVVERTGIESIRCFDPRKRGALKRKLLEEADMKPARDELKKTLQLWTDILSNNAEIAILIEDCDTKFQVSDQLLKKNLRTAVAQSRELETSYRAVDLFFKNTECDKVKNVSFLNAHPEQLKDLDNSIFIDAVKKELVDHYDRLDLQENYSLLVVPGYLGSNKVVEKWAKIAHESKVLLITDFEDVDSPDELMELFHAANLTGSEIYRSNVIMAGNWPIGRGKFLEIAEQEHLYIPPSAALAGKIYKNPIQQVTAGVTYGALNELAGVKSHFKKTEISELDQLGLLPVVYEFGKVLVMSGRTLYNGDNIGYQIYSVVRVFDWVGKVMMDLLNRSAFQNFTANKRKELFGKIVKFLDGITGPYNYIEKFEIKKFEQNPDKKDQIFLNISITPFFPAKSFLIQMDGQNGDEGIKWRFEHTQEK